MPFNIIVLYTRLVRSTPKQRDTWTETQRRGGRDVCRYLGKENSESGLQVPWLGGRSIPRVPPCGGREVTRGEEAARGAREGVVQTAVCLRRSAMKLKEMRSNRKASYWGKIIWQVFQGWFVVTWLDRGRLANLWVSLVLHLFLYSLRGKNRLYIFKYLKNVKKE